MSAPKEKTTKTEQEKFDELLDGTCEELQSACLDILSEEQDALEDITRDDEW